MSSDESRRFTDREVALVLRKASELDETKGSASEGGLSRADLEEIAGEVGISAESIAEAVDSLSTKRVTWSSLGGAPLTRRAVHAVAGELNEEALGRLVRLIDERADAAGTISEALGSVRWTSTDRFRSTQVSLTPANGETAIQVVERAKARWRRVVHLIPGAWGAMIAGGVTAAATVPTAITISAIGVGALAGLAAGRTAWSWMSRTSETRVEKLAGDLAREAREAAGAGLTSTSRAESDES